MIMQQTIETLIKDCLSAIRDFTPISDEEKNVKNRLVTNLHRILSLVKIKDAGSGS